MMWNVEKEKKKKEKWILPPSVGASYYTSKESSAPSRHPINHRVIFHHQLLVPSTLVCCVFKCEMEWETPEKRAASTSASAVLVLLSQFDSCRKMSGDERSCRPWVNGLEPSAGLQTDPVLEPAGVTLQFTYSHTYTVMKTGVRPFCFGQLNTVWNVNDWPLAMTCVGLNQ